MVAMHLVDLIRAKGTIINSSTDAGEGLHPQSKADWRGTNHQQGVAEQQVSYLSYSDSTSLIVVQRCFVKPKNVTLYYL